VIIKLLDCGLADYSMTENALWVRWHQPFLHVSGTLSLVFPLNGNADAKYVSLPASVPSAVPPPILVASGSFLCPSLSIGPFYSASQSKY
jgi:hypothetical protein